MWQKIKIIWVLTCFVVRNKKVILKMVDEATDIKDKVALCYHTLRLITKDKKVTKEEMVLAHNALVKILPEIKDLFDMLLQFKL